ncbi:MAG TPA: DUF420 domain-containing protein [Tepidisphaeraceae bacterium]|nr:DUF420 domain-containing protein [Tepidisphaeraceae bacterium]
MKIEDFPIVNASLNGLSAVLLAIAYILIRRKKYRAHATVMIIALISSATFLGFYLTYHYLRIREGITITHFPAVPIVRPVYLTILTTHTILAVVILPLIFITLFRASKRRWLKHLNMGRITLPLWFYVSVTGVVVYWMLYHVAPRLTAPAPPVAKLVAKNL